MIDTSDVLQWVSGFNPEGDPRAAASQSATLALLQRDGAAWSRDSFDPGHITASGLVLSADGLTVLLVFHRRLRRWLQPGGHVEPVDRSIVATAAREVHEETGVAIDPQVQPVLVGVDVHEIPAARGEPSHRHHDLMFRFVALKPRPRLGGGTHRATWVPADRLQEYGVDEPLLRAAARAREVPPSGNPGGG